MDPFDNGSQEIIRELGPDERYLWSGRPAQGFLLRGSDAFMIPFSLFWGGFAFFWETSVVRMIWLHPERNPGAARYFFPMFGIPFVAVGLYLIAGRFFFDRWQRKSMVYGVTTRRVVILTKTLGRSIKSLGLSTLGNIDFKEKADGTGTIAFGGSDFPNRRRTPPSFDGIAEARRVHEIILKAQRDSFGSPSGR